jgi:uncharacterized protein YxeA
MKKVVKLLSVALAVGAAVYTYKKLQTKKA